MPKQHRVSNCIICEHAYSKPLHEKQGFQYYRCKKCGLEVTHPLPTASQISDYYKSQSEKDSYAVRVNYPREDDVHKKIAAWSLKLNKNKIPKTVLDVGCLDGTLLDFFKENGIITYGVEIQDDAAKIAASKHGNRIFTGTIEAFLEDYKGPQFDLISAIGVIEHVTDPVSFLHAVRKLIKSDGVLVLQTPNTGSLLHHTMKQYWPPYVPIEHIYLFSARNMAALLSKCGFKMRLHKQHWKSLQVEFFYLMTELFMPFAHKILKPIVPRLPRFLRKMHIPLYSGEMLLAADPVP